MRTNPSTRWSCYYTDCSSERTWSYCTDSFTDSWVASPFSRYLIVRGHSNLIQNKALMNKHQPSTGLLVVAEARHLRRPLVLEVEAGFDCGWIECCHNLWLSLSRNLKACQPFLRMLLCTERIGCRTFRFSNANISELVDRYTINMDLLMGAGASMMPQGPRGHEVRSKKKKLCWSCRSGLIEFSSLQEPFPPKFLFDCQHLWPRHAGLSECHQEIHSNL